MYNKKLKIKMEQIYKSQELKQVNNNIKKLVKSIGLHGNRTENMETAIKNMNNIFQVLIEI